MIRIARALALAFLAIAGIGAAPEPATLDSQVVLHRYASHLLTEEAPKVLVFSYTVSQAGPRNIEQTHQIYRSGDLVRDETLMVDGQPLKPKSTRIARYRNRYTIDNLAPRITQYAFLFLRMEPAGYVYHAVPLGATGDFVVDQITIDGRTFLPAEIRFHTGTGTRVGTGSIGFAKAGRYWVPTAVSVQAKIAGKPAREHIVFSGYQFPARLPKSTFQSPKPLPHPALPTF